ncbi:class I adenylate-forming enzyme family protein [Nocardioides sp. Iso805N]|uniref:class I adenylate-forming enzyme family protein n=1 Tax=Nocardioides sp. Iso805N TaxID=1283287 RepID=UPI0003707691|nr:class I adenylate-forming enzyme family protein [Nocardioides sp. Iso805N]
MALTVVGRVVAHPASIVWGRRHSARPIFVEDRGRTWTWHDLAVAASDVARQLGALQGGRVTVTLPNGGAIVAAIVGVWLAGGVPVPLSPRLPAAERSRLLESIGAVQHVAAASVDVTAEVHVGFPSHTARVDETLAPGLVDVDDPGIVLCTSGTTGTPKTIVHSIRAVWGQIDSVSRAVVDPAAMPPLRDLPPDRIQAAPMVHIAAIFAMMFNLWRGRSTVVMQGFEPVRYAELVDEHRVATLSLVPSMIRMLLDSEVTSLAPATLVTSGTAALPPSWRDDFETRFGVPVQATYGQTEVGTIAVEPVADVLEGNRRDGTAGRLVASVAMQVRTQDGRVLGPGETGQLWISGDSVGRIRSDTGAAVVDGWLDTGDIGYLDEDDYVFLTGRSRDLIIRGGLNIIPAEVENVLTDHRRVLEAAVTGRPDPRLGEVPVAWVRLAEEVPDADLDAFVRKRLAAYKIPVAFHRVETFPRTDTGKIRKHELVEERV